ncbi:MAG: prenyltransferase/squalene oxidase repeat-containing protein [Planctomycetota bacterium]
MRSHPVPVGLVLLLLALLLLPLWATFAAGPAIGDSDDAKKDTPPPAPEAEKKPEWEVPRWLTREVKRHVRKGAGRRERAAAMQTPAYVAAIDPALAWLEKSQQESGRWSSEMEGRKGCDVGVTGLAVLAFLSNGETIRSGPHDKTVLNGVKWLMTTQDKDGFFGSNVEVPTSHKTYGHAIATLALAEAYGMTGSVYLKTAAQRGVDCIYKMQNPYLAWRYGYRPGDNDSSVTAWMVHALSSAKAAGLTVSQEAFDGARAWIEKATEPEYGRVGYTSRGSGPARPPGLMDKFPADRSESLTAMGVFARMLTGGDPRKSETIGKGIDLIRKVPLQWDESGGRIDMIYWHFGALAVHQAGGDLWKTWETAMKTQIADRQVKEGEQKGSWPPVGVWGGEGGRVYSTAILTLTLETYRRYPVLFEKGKKSGRRKYRNLR